MENVTKSAGNPLRGSSSAFHFQRAWRRSGAPSKAHYDALVFGNGPAASTFALEMVRHGKTVLLIPPNAASGREPWGETLAPRGAFLLTQIGLFQECLASQYAASRVLSCWGSPDPKESNLAFDPHGHMWHLDRLKFDETLLTHAIQTGVHTLDQESCGIERLTRRGNQWEIPVASSGCERIVRFHHLIDATGRSHKIARRLGARRILRDRLAAISCVREQGGHTAPLLIEAVSQGWWYSLGLPNGELLFALITDPNSTRLSGALRRSVWDAMLAEAPYTKARVLSHTGELRVVGAESSRLDRLCGEGWLAIGDAAMSFDPLSSLGLCCAIEHAIAVAQILSNSQPEAGLAEIEIERGGFFSRYRDQRRSLYCDVRRFSGQAFWQNRVLQ